MSRGRRRIRQEQTAGRPSIFFIVALAAGILFLLWFFLQALKHPVNEQKRGSLKAAIARTIVRISVS